MASVTNRKMKKEEFEIKIAVIGYVSVGKSTLLNALFGNKYSDVAMKRATAAVNHFRISTSPDYSLNEIRSPEYTLEETKKDNEKLRNHVDVEKADGSFNEGSKSAVVQERYFTIALEEPLCEMRDNTSLVFVDIPGINEANRSIYKDYVNEKWDTFDCVIVVMDATQGACTNQQLELLQIVKDNIRAKKDVPVIVLGNKVDDPDNEEISVQVNELRVTVLSVLEQEKRNLLKIDLSLSTLMRRLGLGHGDANNTNVSFIPISAQNAFVYRWATRLTYNDFLELDDEFINKIGKEELGKMKWKRLCREDQVRAAFNAVSSKEEYEDRLKETNFCTFLKTLSATIGSPEKQSMMLEIQQLLHLRHLKNLAGRPCDVDGVFRSMKSAHRILVALGRPWDVVRETFWSLYEREEDRAFESIDSCPDMTVLGAPISLLCNYKRFLNEANYDSTEAVTNAATKLVRRQLGVVISKRYDGITPSWFEDMRPGDPKTWASLSPFDWVRITRAILLLGFEKEFSIHFGREKMHLEMLSMQSAIIANDSSLDMAAYVKREVESIKTGVKGAKVFVWREVKTFKKEPDAAGVNTAEDAKPVARQSYYAGGMMTPIDYPNVIAGPRVSLPGNCPGLQHVMDGSYSADGEFVPKYEKSYKKFVHIDIPASLEDPSHWGHLVYKFLELTTDK